MTDCITEVTTTFLKIFDAIIIEIVPVIEATLADLNLTFALGMAISTTKNRT